jgi:hypothetical protein
MFFDSPITLDDAGNFYAFVHNWEFYANFAEKNETGRNAHTEYL